MDQMCVKCERPVSGNWRLQGCLLWEEAKSCTLLVTAVSRQFQETQGEPISHVYVCGASVKIHLREGRKSCNQGIGSVEQKEGVSGSEKEEAHHGRADTSHGPWKTNAGAAKRCEKEGAAERSHCVLSMTPILCTTQNWGAEEAGVKLSLGEERGSLLV